MSEPIMQTEACDEPENLATVLKFPVRIKDSLTTPMQHDGLRVAFCECGERTSFTDDEDGLTNAAAFVIEHADHMVIIPPLASRAAIL